MQCFEDLHFLLDLDLDMIDRVAKFITKLSSLEFLLTEEGTQWLGYGWNLTKAMIRYKEQEWYLVGGTISK